MILQHPLVRRGRDLASGFNRHGSIAVEMLVHDNETGIFLVRSLCTTTAAERAVPAASAVPSPLHSPSILQMRMHPNKVWPYRPIRSQDCERHHGRQAEASGNQKRAHGPDGPQSAGEE